MAAAHRTPFDALKQVLPSFTKLVDQWTPEQQEALDEYRATSFLYIKKLDRDEVAIYFTGLDHLVQLFSRMFFCGSLSNVKVVPSTSLQALGCTRHSKSTGEVMIEIDVAHPLMNQDQKLSQSAIATILHECCHAYFEVAACDGYSRSSACRQQQCEEQWLENIGHHGHGNYWQYLAYEVEKAANKELGLPPALDLDRRYAAQCHFDDNGGIGLSETCVRRCFGQ